MRFGDVVSPWLPLLPYLAIAGAIWFYYPKIVEAACALPLNPFRCQDAISSGESARLWQARIDAAVIGRDTLSQDILGSALIDPSSVTWTPFTLVPGQSVLGGGGW